MSTGYKKDGGFSYLTVKSKKEEKNHSRRARSEESQSGVF